ncbi:hypothetical protein [Paraburkholderia sp.]|uniref:hypothetical protein n=1 Tax=Paraburkholderia sp. TaxID=1926495 RepID=UPI002F4156A9
MNQCQVFHVIAQHESLAVPQRQFLCIRISVALEAGHTREHGRHTAFPWMQIADDLLERAGFLPGEQVMLSVDHRSGRITNTPDYDYRVAGRYMTEPEAEAMLQRRSKRN